MLMDRSVPSWRPCFPFWRILEIWQGPTFLLLASWVSPGWRWEPNADGLICPVTESMLPHLEDTGTWAGSGGIGSDLSGDWMSDFQSGRCWKL